VPKSPPTAPAEPRNRAMRRGHAAECLLAADRIAAEAAYDGGQVSPSEVGGEAGLAEATLAH
jgi:hypothetical protein